MPAPTPSDDRPLDLAVRLLTYRPTDDEREAWSRPPYVTPAALREDVDAVDAQLAAAEPAVADRPTALRSLAAPLRFAEQLRLWRLTSHPLRVEDAVGLLVAAARLTPDDVDDLVERGLRGATWVGGWRREVVLTHLWADDLAAAATAASAMGDLAWSGFRDIGAVHAARGDAAAFFALWRRYAAGQDRFRMDRLKQDLVQAVAARHGWSAAVTLATDKRLGPKYTAGVFAPWAASGDVDGLLEVFAGDAAGVLTGLDELAVLVDALAAAAPREPLTDVDGMAEVVARLRAVDPTTDKATMRRRDQLLAGLHPAIGEVATLRTVRAAVRTPTLRRDLAMLVRDIRAAAADQPSPPAG